MNRIIKVIYQDGSVLEPENITPLETSEDKQQQWRNQAKYNRQFRSFEEDILDDLGDMFTPVRSSVSGFDNAIRIEDGNPSSIYNTDFDDNNTAILAEGSEALYIGGNSFEIPPDYYGPTTGVSLTNCPQFYIKNKTIF